MLNACEDERMPRPLVDRLYASAREPKSMIWVPGGHVRPHTDVVRPLVDTVLARVLMHNGSEMASLVRQRDHPECDLDQPFSPGVAMTEQRIGD
jgi:hypothetical protein